MERSIENTDETISEGPIYDDYHTFNEDDAEYGKITKLMDQHKIGFVEKRLKHAVYSKNHLTEDLEAKMRTKATRYPKMIDTLFVNPYPPEKKKGKKKKK